MSDTAKLREALEVLSDPGALAPHDAEPYWLSPKTVAVIVEAALELFTIKESGSIIITRDAEGNWPKWAFEQLDYWIMNSGDFQVLFDALADSSKAPDQVGEPG